jgi:hypothetical protein
LCFEFCLVTTSKEFKISELILWSVMLRFNRTLRICLVSETGELDYMIVMSSEANMDVGVMGVCFRSSISSVLVLTLYTCGKGKGKAVPLYA